jgi:hypothetical protein
VLSRPDSESPREGIPVLGRPGPCRTTSWATRLATGLIAPAPPEAATTTTALAAGADTLATSLAATSLASMAALVITGVSRRGARW